MPIYEYICPCCGKEVELLQKFDDPAPLCDCDQENSVEMKKTMSLNTFVLKGTGWYRDGYASNKGVKDKK